MQQYDPWLYDHNGGYRRSQFDRFKSAGRLLQVVLGALCVWALLALLSFVAELGRLDLVDRIGAGNTVSLDDATQSDHLVQIAAGVEIAAFVITGIAFLFWLHRIVANNRALGALATRFSPGYAVGCWFIPFANLALPLVAVREAWRAADPMRLHSTFEDRRRSRAPWYLAGWWVLFEAANFLSYGAGLAASGETNPLQALHNTSMVQLAAIGLAWLAALFAMVTVIQLTRRQEQKAYSIELAFAASPREVSAPEVALTGVPTAHLQRLSSPREA